MRPLQRPIARSAAVLIGPGFRGTEQAHRREQPADDSDPERVAHSERFAGEPGEQSAEWKQNAADHGRASMSRRSTD